MLIECYVKSAVAGVCGDNVEANHQEFNRLAAWSSRRSPAGVGELLRGVLGTLVKLRLGARANTR